MLLVRGGGATTADRSNTVDADIRERVTPVRPDTLQSAWKQNHIRCIPLSVTEKVFFLAHTGQSERYLVFGTMSSPSTYVFSHVGDFMATKVTDTGNRVNHKNSLDKSDHAIYPPYYHTL